MLTLILKMLIEQFGSRTQVIKQKLHHAKKFFLDFWTIKTE